MHRALHYWLGVPLTCRSLWIVYVYRHFKSLFHKLLPFPSLFFAILCEGKTVYNSGIQAVADYFEKSQRKFLIDQNVTMKDGDPWKECSRGSLEWCTRTANRPWLIFTEKLQIDMLTSVTLCDTVSRDVIKGKLYLFRSVFRNTSPL